MEIKRITIEKPDKKTGARAASELVREMTGEEALKVKYLGGGSFGMAYGVCGKKEYVVKFLLADGMLEKETHDLKLLAKYSPVKIPEVYYSGKTRYGTDAYIMERIPGKSALYSAGLFFASARKRAEFAEVVTHALNSIHQCTNPKFGDTMNPNSDTWTEYYMPFAESILRAAEKYFERGELRPDILEAMRLAMNKFEVIFAEPVEKAVLIHGDLNVANIMYAGGKVTGFIDPLNSMYADREYDLFQFYNLTGKRFFLGKMYTEKYGSSEMYSAKIAFYALFNEVYCFIKSGALIPIIMDPLVKNMFSELKKLK